MTTRDIVLIALFAALTAALGLMPPIPVPLIPVPITAQSMAPMLAGAIIGARRGALAMLLFLVLVAAGLPLLSGGRGGLGYFFTPPAGFGLSWPVAAAVIGAMISRGRTTLVWSLIAIAVGGIGVIYGIGVAWLALVAHLPFQKALLGTLAFLPGDAVKVVVAALVADNVRRAYPRAIRG